MEINANNLFGFVPTLKTDPAVKPVNAATTPTTSANAPGTSKEVGDQTNTDSAPKETSGYSARYEQAAAARNAAGSIFFSAFKGFMQGVLSADPDLGKSIIGIGIDHKTGKATFYDFSHTLSDEQMQRFNKHVSASPDLLSKLDVFAAAEIDFDNAWRDEEVDWMNPADVNLRDMASETTPPPVRPKMTMGQWLALELWNNGFTMSRLHETA
ncbi:hypothetical protein [Pseudomonas sp. NPDC096950]|uniref:hypothetical protein n=1 Tax=Pseudomonas sp. NPDC096950 TaxID=3364485 RepID=UPI00383BB0CE